MQTLPLILASKSPRRAALLREAGYLFEHRASGFDESIVMRDNLSVDGYVQRLAEGKAAAVASELDQGIVIGCDTVVCLNNQLFGQPADAAQAQLMIQQLNGHQHCVYTGLCMINTATDRRECRSDITHVCFGPITANCIDRYIASNAWQGKAGAYNLAELNDTWPFEINGDPTNVIGLPMQLFSRMLNDFRRES